MPHFLQNLFSSKPSQKEDPRADQSFYFLPEARGVVHIGANYGQERDLYAKHKLNVLWVECIPEVFQKLAENIRSYRRQKAVQCLLTDRDNQEYSFYLSSNEGAASSSIFDFAKHKEIWPDVHMTSVVKLRSRTLSTMLKKEGIAIEDYDALVMDTQGSELLILKGARELLPRFKFVKTEVADFESYKGGCVLSEMDAFMTEQGFCKAMSTIFASGEGVGSYHEAVYSRR
jgi:2-O-methyltransferase